jgi:hypothetical protein
MNKYKIFSPNFTAFLTLIKKILEREKDVPHVYFWIAFFNKYSVECPLKNVVLLFSFHVVYICRTKKKRTFSKEH